jgi:hypothetical protein
LSGSAPRRILSLHMQVRLTRPSLTQELIDFLGRASCVAVQTKAGTIEVDLPYTNDVARARTDLGLYLAAWQGLHPEATAELEPESVAGPA